MAQIWRGFYDWRAANYAFLRLKFVSKTVIHTKLMKVILISLLLLSFANCPGFVLALDRSHSITLFKEHGVDHLAFFHRAVDSENCPETYFTCPSDDEHHEVHLSASTGLIQKKLHTSSLPINISPANDQMHSVKAVPTYPASTFEPDIGGAQLSLQVLRI